MMLLQTRESVDEKNTDSNMFRPIQTNSQVILSRYDFLTAAVLDLIELNWPNETLQQYRIIPRVIL